MKIKKAAPPAVCNPPAIPIVATSFNKLWDLKRDGITRSMLDKFHACPTKFSLAYISELQGFRTSRSLRFGTAVHAVLEMAYGADMLDDGIFEISDAIPETLAKLRDAEIKSLTGMNREKNILEIKELYGLAEAVCSEYFKFYAQDFTRTWEELEVEFSVPYRSVLGNKKLDEIPIRGKRDGLERIEKGLWLWDHKTKGQINEDTISQVVKFDLQIMLYAWAIKQQYGEYPIGIRYNIIRMPQLRQGKKDTTLDMFLDRVKADVKAQPEHYFMRFEHIFSREQLKEFEMELERIMIEIVQWDELKAMRTYKRTVSCENRYGACEFIGLCSGKVPISSFQKRTTAFPELTGESEE